MPTGRRKWPHRRIAAYLTHKSKPLWRGKVALCGEDHFGKGDMLHLLRYSKPNSLAFRAACVRSRTLSLPRICVT
jgi:hypothetical protein